MATFEESILTPVFLLLIGAVVSTMTSTWVTVYSENRKRQNEIATDNRKRELETKADITSKMAEALAQLDAEATFLIYRKEKLEKEEKDAFFQNAKKWYIDGRLIHSKLEAYFPDKDLQERWDACYDLLDEFVNASQIYFDQDPVVRRNLRQSLDNIKQHLSDEKRINWENLRTTFDEKQWLFIQSIIRMQGDEIITDVLKLPIKVF